MSRTLRLSIIAVMLLSTTALGMIAYNTLNPPAQPAPPPPEPAPTPVIVRGTAPSPRAATSGTRHEVFGATALPPSCAPSHRANRSGGTRSLAPPAAAPAPRAATQPPRRRAA